MKLRHFLILLAGLGLGGLWLGCYPQHEDLPAYVRFLNAMDPADATLRLDVLVDDRVAWQAMALDSIGQVTHLGELPTKRQTIRVARAGDATHRTLFSSPVDLDLQAYMCVLSGLIRDDGQADVHSTVLLLRDDLHWGTGHAGIRTVNALWDSMTIRVEIPDLDTLVLPLVAFHRSSDYVTVPPGEHTLQCSLEGGAPRSIPFAVPDSSDISYTVYVMGGHKYARPWLKVVADAGPPSYTYYKLPN